MTDSNTLHPWAKYYADRGIPRVAVSRLAPRRAARPPAAAVRGPAEPKVPALSAELAAAVAMVSAQTFAPGTDVAPFVTPMRKETDARELEFRTRVRYAGMALAAATALAVLHVAAIQTVFRRPFESAVQAHVRNLPAALLPFFSSESVPLHAGRVVIAQEDQIDDRTIRYVASVTLRLDKPLYVAAVSNGTAAYRRVQESIVAAHNQELRFNLFPPAKAPVLPEMPLLLQRAHQAGETIVVRVPFTARRFGWSWRLATPRVELRVANRTLEGASLDGYAANSYLIYGDATTLAEMRMRVNQANNYVVAVARAVRSRGRR